MSSPPQSQSHEADWWKEAAKSFESKITSETNSNNYDVESNNYGSIAPPSYVTSPNRYSSFVTGDDTTPIATSVPLQDYTATNYNNGLNNDSIFEDAKLFQPPSPREGTLSDISNDSSDSESDDDYSSYASDESDHSLERPHRTVGLIFFDTLRLVAISANVRFFNTEMVPVLMAWKTMDILNKCLRIFMGFSAVLLIIAEFPEMFPFLKHDLSRPTPPLYFTNWIPRGIFYLFLGLVMFEQQVVVAYIDIHRHASKSTRFLDGIFMVISAFIMVLVGMTYILLGIFCVQRIMERVRREESERWDEYWEKLKKLEEEEDLEEEREWLLENGGGEFGGEVVVGDGKSTKSGAAIGFKERWRKWRKRFKRRYRRGKGWWRTIDFKC